MKEMDHRVAGHLAAGPVEDLMSEFGETYLERVEHLSEDSRFKRMLCSVWQDRMSEGLWSRFQQAREGAC